MTRWRFTTLGHIFSVTLARKAGNWHYWVADNGFEFKTNGTKGAETPERALRGLCWALCCEYFDPRKEFGRDNFRDRLVIAMKAFDRARATVAIESAKGKECCFGDGI